MVRVKPVIFVAGAILLAFFVLKNVKQPQWVVFPAKKIEIQRIVGDSDRDGDGVPDADDIVEGARREVKAGPLYKDAYYSGGYPPEGEGVCTDLVWKSFENAGYSLKDMMDRDIKLNPSAYPRVAGKPDPNIDFRRVPNHVSFFGRKADSLTTDIRPWDIENLKQWQGGDIVAFGQPLEHIAVVSDRRRPDGVPYIIHNAGPRPREEDMLLSWPSKITHHFRFPGR